MSLFISFPMSLYISFGGCGRFESCHGDPTAGRHEVAVAEEAAPDQHPPVQPGAAESPWKPV